MGHQRSSVLLGRALAELSIAEIDRCQQSSSAHHDQNVEVRATRVLTSCKQILIAARRRRSDPGLGLTTYASFDAFASANGYALGDARIVALKNVYGDDISKLDSIVGGLLEKRYADSQLGVTFTLLNAIQFDVLKAGDPFYFENRLADNPELIADIKGITQAEINDRVSGTDHSHLDSFQVFSRAEYSDGRDVKYGADNATYLKADLMIGKGGNDTLYGKNGNDTLYGDAGNDKLDGGIGDDFLKGGTGHDELYGGKGSDHAWGEDGNDCINLDGGDDWANGGAGNDQISCGDGNDIALGKEGNDDLSGGKGNDELFGGDGKDDVSGDDGDDKCYGGAGNDCVAGGKGNDLIVGEGGNDELRGGAGYDTFAFGAGSGKDKITDFNTKQDQIDLSELEGSRTRLSRLKKSIFSLPNTVLCPSDAGKRSKGNQRLSAAVRNGAVSILIGFAAQPHDASPSAPADGNTIGNAIANTIAHTTRSTRALELRISQKSAVAPPG
jgi:Ca2+-binding RTX toxin-like protein